MPVGRYPLPKSERTIGLRIYSSSRCCIRKAFDTKLGFHPQHGQALSYGVQPSISRQGDYSSYQSTLCEGEHDRLLIQRVPNKIARSSDSQGRGSSLAEHQASSSLIQAWLGMLQRAISLQDRLVAFSFVRHDDDPATLSIWACIQPGCVGSADLWCLRGVAVSLGEHERACPGPTLTTLLSRDSVPRSQLERLRAIYETTWVCASFMFHSSAESSCGTTHQHHSRTRGMLTLDISQHSATAHHFLLPHEDVKH